MMNTLVWASGWSTTSATSFWMGNNEHVSEWMSVLMMNTCSFVCVSDVLQSSAPSGTELRIPGLGSLEGCPQQTADWPPDGGQRNGAWLQHWLAVRACRSQNIYFKTWDCEAMQKLHLTSLVPVPIFSAETEWRKNRLILFPLPFGEHIASLRHDPIKSHRSKLQSTSCACHNYPFFGTWKYTTWQGLSTYSLKGTMYTNVMVLLLAATSTEHSHLVTRVQCVQLPQNQHTRVHKYNRVLLRGPHSPGGHLGSAGWIAARWYEQPSA